MKIEKFNNFLNEEMEVKSMEDFSKDVSELENDTLKGGEAEGMTIEDVAKMHNVPVEYLEKIMPDAIEIEMEHTDDPEVAARIALDHLAETPLYYDEVRGLPNMEEELEEIEDEEEKDIIDGVLKYGERVKKYNEMGADLEKAEKELEQAADEYAQEHQERVNDVEVDVQENVVIKLSDYIKESSLNDFIDSIGDTEIWYEKETNFDGWDFRERMYAEEPEHDYEYTKRYGKRIDPKNLEETHVLLGKVGETDLDKVYMIMNNWGVGEESNKFLMDKGVHHTSMSIGDIIKIGDDIFFVDRMGFKNIKDE